MIEALLGKPKAITLNGAQFYLSRPTMADMVAAQHEQAKGDAVGFQRWMIWNHLRRADLGRVLTSPEEADRIEASTAMEILQEIDQLWGEGRD